MQVGQRVQLKFLHNPIGVITSVIDGFTMNDIQLVGYQSHGTIKADMAV